MIKVRLAKNVDLNLVHALNQANIPMVGDVDFSWMQRYFVEATLFIVAEIDSRFAGYMIAMDPHVEYTSENYRWFQSNFSNFLYVDRLAVSENARGLGVGKALYSFAEDFCRKNQFETITCEVNVRPANDRSYQFHQSLGFKEVGQQETKGGQIRVAMLAKEIR